MCRTSRAGIGGMKVWNSKDGASARLRWRHPGKDGAEQAVPGQEEMVGGYSPDVLEQAAPGLLTLAGLLPLKLGKVSSVVHGEGQQVEDDEQAGQRFFPAAKLCPRWWPPVLSTLKVSFSALPPRPAVGGQLGHGYHPNRPATAT